MSAFTVVVIKLLVAVCSGAALEASARTAQEAFHLFVTSTYTVAISKAVICCAPIHDLVHLEHGHSECKWIIDNCASANIFCYNEFAVVYVLKIVELGPVTQH